jgi:hypothetical protein
MQHVAEGSGVPGERELGSNGPVGAVIPRRPRPTVVSPESLEVGDVLDQESVVKAWEGRSRLKPGVTCVAFIHEHRPEAIDALIDRLQASLRHRLSHWLESDWIRLTPAGQVHATLIGLEATLEHGELVNTNGRSRPAAGSRPMDLGGFAEYLRRREWPIRLRFGGFSPGDVNPYDPRPPFLRSFAIRPDGLVVAIGWPMVDGVIRPTLLDLRKAAERFHIVHKYHARETDRDNDAFLVLGAVTPMPWLGTGRPRDGFDHFLAALARAQDQIRESLQAAPLELELGREHCCFVRYHTADLAAVPERQIVSCDAITAAELRGLYLSG